MFVALLCHVGNCKRLPSFTLPIESGLPHCRQIRDVNVKTMQSPTITIFACVIMSVLFIAQDHSVYQVFW